MSIKKSLAWQTLIKHLTFAAAFALWKAFGNYGNYFSIHKVLASAPFFYTRCTCSKFCLSLSVWAGVWGKLQNSLPDDENRTRAAAAAARHHDDDDDDDNDVADDGT